MEILVIEDEPKTSAALLKGLREAGLPAQAAADGETGLRLAREGGFDLVILDVMLPGRSGWTVIQDLRASGFRAPVLILTAMDAIADRVRGLELGADDYLVKPFAFSELLARVRGLLRRPPLATAEAPGLADLRMTASDARRAGSALNLTRQEFLLLTLFVQRQGEVLSRALIAEQVWGMNYDCETNIVDVAVRRLRRKVDDPFEQKLIHTVRGLGYEFALR